MSTDQHIVIEAKQDQEGRFVYRVVLGPVSWRTAQAEWDRRDRSLFGAARRGHYFMVRAEDDPTYADLPRPRTFSPSTANLDHRGERPIARAVKYAAKVGGYEGRKGGWIYRVGSDRPIAQGWSAMERSFRSRGLVVVVGEGYLATAIVPDPSWHQAERRAA